LTLAELEKHNPMRIFAMYSGGDGSLAATHFAMANGADEVLHISTGIGVDENAKLSVIEVVRETCRSHGWPLRVETPPDLTYEQMVLKHGFPGPGGHLYPYVWLKDRAIAKVVRETKTRWRDRVGFSTGVRNGDSARRMGFISPIVRDGARVWIAPSYGTRLRSA
jgi:3'-phosphoadenosine 5'-phosphosulfate sulfotransferase (PAPS reductase)/FAD synthetase